MARIQDVEVEDVHPDLQHVLDGGSNLFRVLLHSPGASRSASKMGFHLRRESALNPRLRELAILEVARVTGTEYVWAHHVDLSLRRGWLSRGDIEAVRLEQRGSASGLSSLEQHVRQAAREATSAYAVSDGCFASLRETLPNDQLVDLVLAIGFYGLMARLLQTLEVELEDRFATLLTEFPLCESGRS